MLGGILSTSQKRTGSGGITVAGGRNGLSVDNEDYIVLGNDEGDDLAQLLSDREIPLNEHELSFTSVARGSYIFIGPGGLPQRIGMIDAVVPINQSVLDNATAFISAKSEFPANFYVTWGQNEDDTSEATCESIWQNDASSALKIGIAATSHGTYPGEGFLFADTINIGAASGNPMLIRFAENAVVLAEFENGGTDNLLGTFPNGAILAAPSAIVFAASAGGSLNIGMRIKDSVGGNLGGITQNVGSGILTIETVFGAGNPEITLDFATHDVTFFNAIKTGDPGTGAAKWKLGTVVAGAVALDAANYVEVNIAGTIVKLGIVV